MVPSHTVAGQSAIGARTVVGLALLAMALGGCSGARISGTSGVTVPGAPVIGTATAGDGSASIVFTPPGSNGGAAISGYTATCTGGGASRTGAVSSSPIVVAGLTNAIAYGCSVRARNSAGDGLASATVSVTPTAPVTAHAPNILFVIADDFGLDASPCHPAVGASKPAMPNLSSLCQRGVVFDQAWAHPTCTPTRASLLTGQYGVHTNVMAVDEVLSNTDTILIRVQQGANPYAVAVIGKWHVSGANAAANSPASFGAQYFAGFLNGALPDYFNWRLTLNGTTSTHTSYATTVFTDQAITWIAAQQKPWFLWLAYNAPHTPFHTLPASLYSHAGLKDGTATDNRTRYFAAAEAMDAELGRLLGTIPAATLANTTIVFMGDNGTPGQVVQSPYSSTRAKDFLYQGGLSVPLMVAGAGVTRAGQREAALVNSEDLFATFMTLTQRVGNVPADSISFAAALSATSFAGRTHAYIDFRDSGSVVTAIRDSRYKLIEFAGVRRELYDLATDPYESSNLIAGGISNSQDAIIQGLVAKRGQLQQ